MVRPSANSIDVTQVIEISPFYLRSKYITVMLIAVAAGLFFSNYVNPIGEF